MHTAENVLLQIAPSVAGAAATANAPDGIAWGIAQKFGVGLIHTILAVDCVGRAWIEGYDGITWNGWQPIATAAPPQEFALPLAEGIIATSWGASLYWKNQFGEVTVLLFVAPSSGTISSQQTVALLPAGFRPSNRVSAPAYCNMSSGANGLVSIEPSGEIYITNSTNDVFLNGCAMISFIAAD